MTDNITLTGLVATAPKHLMTSEGLSITSFRLASTQRRYDRSRGAWVDGDTNWYTITTFRQLALNVAGSVAKGDRIVATGRLRIRPWEAGERSGTNIEVDADAVGHDLSWGTTAFTRTVITSKERAQESSSSPASSGGNDSQASGDTDAAAESDESEFPPAATLHAESEVPVPF